MDKSARIYVAGHRGLVGSAIVRELQRQGYGAPVVATHAELDLTSAAAVADFFAARQPEYVFLAAAKVGGIVANNSFPAEFIRENLLIQTNVIHEAWRSGVRKLLFLGSSCIYPKFAPQPMQEEHLLTGELEPTNEAYAIAKIAGIKMCASYNRQYGTNFLSVMPTNLYGPGDNYDLQTSHVLPALIRKMHEAKLAGADSVEIWGTGNPRREFLYSDDLANACVFLMQRMDAADVGEIINIGVGRDISIAELAGLVAEVVGFTGQLRFNTDHPDGTPRKLLDVDRLRELGWEARTSLRDGITRTYRDWVDSAASTS